MVQHVTPDAQTAPPVNLPTRRVRRRAIHVYLRPANVAKTEALASVLGVSFSQVVETANEHALPALVAALSPEKRAAFDAALAKLEGATP